MEARSPITLLILAPLLGALLVIFLPFVGLFLFGQVFISKLYALYAQHSERVTNPARYQ
jgi:hypothetical protein